jgi:phosphoribosyl 1,2-cyclic phosphodiesterase
MITFSLQSGSNGNCIYVEAGNVRLLFDAGISGRQAAMRLADYGRDIRNVTALIISHEHRDHICSAGVFQRKFGFPIYVTRATWRATPDPLGPVTDVRPFTAGGRIEFDGVTVHTIKTPHDAVDGTAFIVEHERKRLGILTDLGHPFRSLQNLFTELDAAYLESNYDPEMLEAGSYPAWLRDRIRGDRGHLANPEAARLVRRARSKRLQWVALAHLSEENNNPELAVDTHRATVGRMLPLYVAGRYGLSELLNV